MLKFEKPDYKVKEYVKDSFYGKFELEPLERGFGTTLGNDLIAASLPEPKPFTSTFTFFIPAATASLPAASADIPAANAKTRKGKGKVVANKKK